MKEDTMKRKPQTLVGGAGLTLTVLAPYFRDQDSNQMPLGSMPLVNQYANALTDTSRVGGCGVWSGAPPD